MAEKITNRWKHHKREKIFLEMWGMSKKHHKREKLLCIPQEQRRSSREVGETPGTGEESPSFGEEPLYHERGYPAGINL